MTTRAEVELAAFLVELAKPGCGKISRVLCVHTKEVICALDDLIERRLHIEKRAPQHATQDKRIEAGWNSLASSVTQGEDKIIFRIEKEIVKITCDLIGGIKTGSDL